MKQEKYQTPSISPKCVHYWDAKFLGKTFWADWIIMKSVGESMVPDIKKKLKCDDKKAHQVLWNAFVEATCGDEDSPMWTPSGDFIRSLGDYDLAYYLMHLYIGSDINDGFSEAKAWDRYKAWLKEKKNNGNYGVYRVTPEFEIVLNSSSNKKRKK